MKLIDKYTYNELPRDTCKDTGIRHYTTPKGNKVASVTTILSATKSARDKAGLQGWRNFVGDAEADRVCTEAANVGTLMHNKLEDHCLGRAKKPGGNLIHKQAHNMAQEIIKHGLIHVTDLWAVEAPLFFEGLYAGTTDLVGLWKGKPAIMDFKQSNKPKTDSMVKDYKLQLAAYALAHNEMFGTDIDRGVIIMCVRSKMEYAEWEIGPDEMKLQIEMWLDRVEQYYKLNA